MGERSSASVEWVTWVSLAMSYRSASNDISALSDRPELVQNCLPFSDGPQVVIVFCKNCLTGVGVEA